jgi:S-adenosylmethionine decarboxylase
MSESILGQHAVYSIRSSAIEKLLLIREWKAFIHEQILNFKLTELGKIEHQFDNAGFTSVHCLSESHIAVHTWPEIGIVTFDVYLCNYRTNNDRIVLEIASNIVAFFEGEVIKKQLIQR